METSIEIIQLVASVTGPDDKVSKRMTELCGTSITDDNLFETLDSLGGIESSIQLPIPDIRLDLPEDITFPLYRLPKNNYHPYGAFICLDLLSREITTEIIEREQYAYNGVVWEGATLKLTVPPEIKVENIKPYIESLMPIWKYAIAMYDVKEVSGETTCVPFMERPPGSAQEVLMELVDKYWQPAFENVESIWFAEGISDWLPEPTDKMIRLNEVGEIDTICQMILDRECIDDCWLPVTLRSIEDVKKEVIQVWRDYILYQELPLNQAEAILLKNSGLHISYDFKDDLARMAEGSWSEDSQTTFKPEVFYYYDLME